jgi:hypothetical protein
VCAQGLLNHLPLPALVLTGAQGLLNNSVEIDITLCIGGYIQDELGLHVGHCTQSHISDIHDVYGVSNRMCNRSNVITTIPATIQLSSAVILNKCPPLGGLIRTAGGGGACSLKNIFNIIILIRKTKNNLLLSYYRICSKFTIALICFQSRYLIHFEISNKVIGEDRFEGGGGGGRRVNFMFIKRGHG